MPLNIDASSPIERIAETLATQWVDLKDLDRLDIPYAKGRFTPDEKSNAEAAIEAYQQEHDLDDDALYKVIFDKPSGGFWPRIARTTPMRPLRSVVSHVRRARDANARQGSWSLADDAALKSAVQSFGRNWECVSEKLGRMAEDCRIRYTFAEHRDLEQKGHWTPAEEARLVQIIRDLHLEGRRPTSRGFWTVVAGRMEHTRNSKQCRVKWDSQLRGTVLNDGHHPLWSPADDFILLQKVTSLRASSEYEINWAGLMDPAWNLWSAPLLKKKWQGLKTRGHVQDAPLADVLNTLRLVVPPPTGL